MTTLPRLPLIPLAHLETRPEPERRLRLMEQVRHVLRSRRYSPRTEGAYTHWIRRYILFHGRRHPRELTATDVRDFLSHLTVAQQVAASTQNQALAALLFLYGKVLLRHWTVWRKLRRPAGRGVFRWRCRSGRSAPSWQACAIRIGCVSRSCTAAACECWSACR